MEVILDHAHKAYGSNQVLRGASMHCAAGEVVTILGRSGTGKSTLLNCLGLLDHFDDASYRCGEVDLHHISNDQRRHWRAGRIGFVFQGFHLLPEFDVLENILMAARCAEQALAPAREHALHLLGQVGLGDRCQQAITTLSGGEAQRVALCRALVTRPTLLLADEPTGNLDPETAADIFQLLGRLAVAERSAVLLVTHDPAIAAQADRCYRLDQGLLTETATH